MDKLIINFCKEFDEAVIENKNIKLIDLSNVCQKENIDYIFDVEQHLDIYFKVFDQLYKNDPFRNHEVCGYPIFHLTNLSEKHSEKHWLIDFSKLLTLIRLNNNLLKSYKIIELHSPIIIKKNEPFIKRYLEKYGLKCITFFKYYGTIPNRTNILLKSLIVASKYLRFLFSKKEFKDEDSDFLFISFEKNKSKAFLALKNTFSHRNKNLSFLNLHFWTEKNSSKNVNYHFSRLTMKFAFIFKFLKEISSLLLFKKKYCDLNVEGLKLRSVFVIDEIYYSLSDYFYLELIISFNLLKNYFSNIDSPINIFYEDEFYISGKCISLSKSKSQNRSMIRSYGIQHGHINIYQTLYTFTNYEVVSNIPAPDFFIIWSKYYEDILTKNNVSKVTSLLKLGSPSHFEINQIDKKPKNIKQKIKYLWCSTNYNTFIFQLKILKNSVLWEDAEIKIRQHPKHKFLNHDKCLRLGIPEDMVLNDSTTLTEDIVRADCILTTWFSTIIIDALVNDTVVVALSDNMYKSSLDGTGIPIFSSSQQLNDLSLKDFQNGLKFSQENILSDIIINNPSKLIEYFFNNGKEVS